MFELYKYIHVRPEMPASYAIESKYTPETITSVFTVFDGIEYRVYSDVIDFYTHMMKMDPAERLFHEVIFDQPQKLKFDIDANVADLQNIKYGELLTSILESITDTFLATFGEELSPNNIIICESSGNDKYSAHIIIDNYYVDGCMQAKEFTRRVAECIPSVHKRFLDMSVNKNIQNFRIIGCRKRGSDRVKRLADNCTHINPIRCFITDVADCTQLCINNINMPAYEIMAEVVPDDMQMAINTANKLITDHKYKYTRGNMLFFTRIMPSHCAFCDREHTRDNTLMVQVKNIRGVISLRAKCRKYSNENTNTGSYKVIAEFPSQGGIDEYNQAELLQSIISNSSIPRANIFEERPTPRDNIYDEPALRDFELTRTLIVRAAMKMGKTKKLREYIDTYFNRGLRDPCIRFISFRQTFSSNIKEKFDDFILYSDVKGPLVQPRLIVQVESLWRLDIYEGMEPPDLLVLDECESIFEQFDSGLLKNFADCFGKFAYLLRYSKHVVCMDANVGDRTYRILDRMRGLTKPVNNAGDNTGAADYIYHHNKYKNATGDTYYVTSDTTPWLGLLYSCIEADERVAIPINSLEMGKIIAASLADKWPNKRIKLYSSETPMSEKCEHFSNVDLYWKQYDVLIYTPTVSAGVSFEEHHFDKIFGYFTDMSCPAETCVQMIGRIRAVKDRQYYICIQARGNVLPTDINAIRDQLYNNRANLYREYDNTGLIPIWGPDGSKTHYESDYFHLWLENTRMRNISKNSFARQIVGLFTGPGAAVHHLSNEMYENMVGESIYAEGELSGKTIIADHTAKKKELSNEQCRRIATADDLTPEEIGEIQFTMASGGDITDEQRYSLEKYRLRTDYEYEGVIDEKFVAKYGSRQARIVYKNRRRLKGHESIDAALEHIKKEEALVHLYTMNLGPEYNYQDLGRRYVFDRHRYALGLLKLCGWKHIDDPQYIHKLSIQYNLSHNDHKTYWEAIKPACTEFEIKPPLMRMDGSAPLDDMLRPINKILLIMYGLSIRARRNDPDMLFLSCCASFM